MLKFSIRSKAIDRDGDKANDGEPEAVLNSEFIDELALDQRQDGTTNDGHDQKGGAELGFLRRHAAEGNSVDGGKHERHAGVNSDDAGESDQLVEEDCTEEKGDRQQGKEAH